MRRILLLIFIVLLSRICLSNEEENYHWLQAMTSQDTSVRKKAADRLMDAADSGLVPAMVDTLFYMPRAARPELRKILKHLTHDDVGNDYYDWVQYIGRRSDLKPSTGYIGYKASLLTRIDPRYSEIFYENVFTRIRPEEIVWGGAKVDGIPALENAEMIAASKARLQDSEKVFGISLKGEHRAYPLRYLSWHEMVNDRIQDEPFTISF